MRLKLEVNSKDVKNLGRYSKLVKDSINGSDFVVSFEEHDISDFKESDVITPDVTNDNFMGYIFNQDFYYGLTNIIEGTYLRHPAILLQDIRDGKYEKNKVLIYFIEKETKKMKKDILNDDTLVSPLF
ncbi:MAG: hypothetical protein IKP45_05585 [Bacteroidales bacterium]|nr:hypothetical protein [Bacteroidales bacterium]